jgi:hypothetical protein
MDPVLSALLQQALFKRVNKERGEEERRYLGLSSARSTDKNWRRKYVFTKVDISWRKYAQLVVKLLTGLPLFGFGREQKTPAL